jgi:hypothetical protein
MAEEAGPRSVYAGQCRLLDDADVTGAATRLAATATATATATAATGTGTGTQQWVTNPAFDGGMKTGWTGVYSGVSKVGVTKDSTGNWRLQISTTSASSAPAGVNNVSPYWVNNASVSGTVYTATAQAVPSVAGEQAYILVRELTASGAGVGYAQSAISRLTNTSALTQLPSVGYQARGTGDSIRYSLIVTNLSGKQVLYADNFSLTSPS